MKSKSCWSDCCLKSAFVLITSINLIIQSPSKSSSGEVTAKKITYTTTFCLCYTAVNWILFLLFTGRAFLVRPVRSIFRFNWAVVKNFYDVDSSFKQGTGTTQSMPDKTNHCQDIAIAIPQVYKHQIYHWLYLLTRKTLSWQTRALTLAIYWHDDKLSWTYHHFCSTSSSLKKRYWKPKELLKCVYTWSVPLDVPSNFIYWTQLYRCHWKN